MRTTATDRLRNIIGPTVRRRVGKLLPERVRDGIEARSGGIAVVAYPKSGRTWLRLMLGRVIQQRYSIGDVEPFDLDGLARRNPAVPRIQISSDGSGGPIRPADVTTSKRQYRNKRVVLLVRDPRDVVVSWFFHLHKRTRDVTLRFGDEGVPADLSTFIRSERGSLATIVAFFNAWADQSDIPASQICVVRYEDLRADPRAQLARITTFLGLDVPDDVVREAVEFGSFDRMKEMEAAGTLSSRALRPGDLDDPESFKVRRGVVGGYTDYLDDDDVRYMDDYVRTRLRPSFGYA